MSKFYGNIGFGIQVPREPGSDIYEEKIEEHPYFGDVIETISKWENGDHLNDDITINNTISIMADSFATTHCQLMKYVDYMGAKWKIKSVKLAYPRLTLTIGGVYNE